MQSNRYYVQVLARLPLLHNLFLSSSVMAIATRKTIIPNILFHYFIVSVYYCCVFIY